VVRTGIDVYKLWFALVVRRAHHGPQNVAAADDAARSNAEQRVL
jgi:hypothetical protein